MIIRIITTESNSSLAFKLNVYATGYAFATVTSRLNKQLSHVVIRNVLIPETILCMDA